VRGPKYNNFIAALLGGAGKSFVPSLPIINEQFTTGTYFPGPITSDLVDVRSTTKTVTNASGALSSVAINTLPISNAGMLVEPAATNGFLQSQTFLTSWTTGGVTAGSATTAPDGTTTAQLVSQTAATGLAYAEQIGRENGTAYTLSVYFKYSGSNFALAVGDGVASGAGVVFNAATASVVGNASAGSGISVVASGVLGPYADGFYRAYAAFSKPSTASSQGAVWLQNGTGTAWFPSFTGNPSNGVYLWGMQSEVDGGSHLPSSYIPTTTTAIARAADSITIQETGITTLYVTFDNGSQQTITGINPATQYVIPTSLNRPLITQIAGYAVALPTQNLMRAITINAAQVSTANKTNFPVLVQGTYSYLANVANGGSVNSLSGYDIVFYADTARRTKLNFEIDSYNPVTGAISAWVMIPTVSHTVNTTFYMYYGDATITTDQSNKTGVWDANYQAVYHVQPSNQFTRNPTNPVMNYNQAAWNASQLEEPIVFTNPTDSTHLQMVFGGMAAPVNTGVIQVGGATATAADPTTWVFDTGNPELSVGAGGSWDSNYIRPGSVLNNGDGTESLYYTGNNGTIDQIGLATRTIGTTAWTKYAGNPILTPTGQGFNDGDHVSQPAAFDWTDGKRYMYYAWRNGSTVLAGYKIASSTDKVTFAKGGDGAAAGAVVIPLGVSGSYDDTLMEDHSVNIAGGVIYVTYESEGDGGRYWTINMASATSPGGPFTKSPNNPIFWGSGWLTNNSPTWDGAAVATPRWFTSAAGRLLLYYVAGQSQNPYSNAQYAIGIADFGNGTTLANVFNASLPVASDSTSNANTATINTGGSAAGLIGQAATMNGQGCNIATPLNNLSYSAGTIEWLQNPTQGDGDGAVHGWWGQGKTSGTFLDAQKFSDGTFYVGWHNTAGADDRVVISAANVVSNNYYPVGQFSHYAYTWGGGVGTLFMNGVAIGTHAVSAVYNIGSPLLFGEQNGPSASSTNFFGEMDEIRVSNVARSADWLLTQWNNFNSPSSFYGVSLPYIRS